MAGLYDRASDGQTIGDGLFYQEGMMLGTSKIVAFAAVRDRDAARKFYRDTLGLRLVGEDQFAIGV
jgi:hypothetical protein